MKPPFVPESQGPNTKYFQPKYTDRTYEQHQGGCQSPLSPEGVDTDGPEGEDLPRQLNVFSSFFFEQEEYASELAIAKVSKSQSKGGAAVSDADEDECAREDGLQRSASVVLQNSHTSMPPS